MANFKQAINWLKEGKKVRRPSWKDDSYWILGTEESIQWSNRMHAHVHLNQIKATDWEINEDEKNKLKILGAKILNENNPEFFAELLEKGVDAIPISKYDSCLSDEITGGENRDACRKFIRISESRISNQLRIHWNWLKNKSSIEVTNFINNIINKRAGKELC